MTAGLLGPFGCGPAGDPADGGYFDALVRIFEQTLKAIAQLPASGRHALIARLFRPKFHSMLHNSLIPKKAHDCV